MTDRIPIPLTPISIGIQSPEFQAISAWPFPDPFVSRLLKSDIPQRAVLGNCRIWIYRDPQRQVVGFGTIDVCDDYAAYTSGKSHPYIPLLAVNPTIKSLGYGTTIVRHLIDEAALLAYRPGSCHDVLFLDVYTTSEKAIALYIENGFAPIATSPIPDLQEADKLYIVMVKRVAVTSLLHRHLGLTPTSHRSATNDTGLTEAGYK